MDVYLLRSAYPGANHIAGDLMNDWEERELRESMGLPQIKPSLWDRTVDWVFDFISDGDGLIGLIIFLCVLWIAFIITISVLI